jgi:hypothetical protein
VGSRAERRSPVCRSFRGCVNLSEDVKRSWTERSFTPWSKRWGFVSGSKWFVEEQRKASNDVRRSECESLISVLKIAYA